ncbi:MAG: hypothetical protein HY556_04545 [Euryarchaeota archaeon]|nr:hypothetical protein [Euryarchaeota archaeon]
MPADQSRGKTWAPRPRGILREGPADVCDAPPARDGCEQAPKAHGRRFARRVGASLKVSLAAIALLLVAFSAAEANPHGIVGYAATGCVCHSPSPASDVEVVLDGFPQTYAPGRNYDLKISILGGPPSVTTQGGHAGGFNLRASAGKLAVPLASDAVMLSKKGDTWHDMTAGGHEETPFAPSTWGELSFTHEGANQRQWRVQWTAPEPGTGPVTMELAGLAANGDHSNSSYDAWDLAVLASAEGEPAPITERYSQVFTAAALLVAVIGGGLLVARRVGLWGATGNSRRKPPPGKRGAFIACSQCGATLREAGLKDHLRRVHGETRPRQRESDRS